MQEALVDAFRFDGPRCSMIGGPGVTNSLKQPGEFFTADCVTLGKVGLELVVTDRLRSLGRHKGGDPLPMHSVVDNLA